MHPFDDNYLSKMLPGFEKKPAPDIIPPPEKALVSMNERKTAKAILLPENPAPQMLDSISSFIRRYLICDEHQLTILALWIVHTWSYSRFLTTAYLDIRSPEPQCGKSRCLDLLYMLSNRPWFATGASPATIRDRLLHQRSLEKVTVEKRIVRLPAPFTTLLDNYHHTFGSSERQALVAMLTAGTRQTSLFAYGRSDYCLFGPKAFAGNSRLPLSLAAHCIPIVLRRKRPSETVQRFDRASDRLPANVLDWLYQIDEDAYLNSDKTWQAPLRLSSHLTARQQDCAEPLLHVADAVGGSWPEKARAAISAVFKLSDWSDPIQVLSDVRSWFYMKNNPEYLLTRDLLPLLISMEQRPWSAWTRKSGFKLGALLRHFGIFSRNLTVGGQKGIKGYLLEDFKDAWERYLPPLHDEVAQPRKGE